MLVVVAAATPLGGDYAGDVRTMGNVLELTRDISDRFRRNDVRLGAVQRELVAIQLTEEPPASAGPSSLPTLHAQGERLLALLAQLKQEVTVSGERMNATSRRSACCAARQARGPPSLLQLELRLGNASRTATRRLPPRPRLPCAAARRGRRGGRGAGKAGVGSDGALEQPSGERSSSSATRSTARSPRRRPVRRRRARAAADWRPPAEQASTCYWTQ